MIGEGKGLASSLWSRILHLTFRVQRGLTIGVRAVVQSEDGKFLLVRHTYTSGWHLPGGGVEPSETAEEALARELEQETGLEIVGSPKLHGIFFNSSVSKHDHVLVYVCQTKGDVLPKPTNLEIAEVGFYALVELPKGIDRGTEMRLKEITTDQKPDLNW